MDTIQQWNKLWRTYVQDSIKDRLGEYNKYFEDLNALLVSIKWAKDNHLDAEWLGSFLEDYIQTKDIRTSIQHADREWDIWTTKSNIT